MPKTTANEEWKSRVRGILKAELARRDIKQTQLANMLTETYGLQETPQSLSNKIRRGAFSAVFMFQILEVIGCDSLALPRVTAANKKQIT